MKDKNEKQVRNMHPVIRRLITLAVVVAVAWLLGQCIVPMAMKAIFL